MCGLVGVLQLRDGATPDQQLLRRMAASIAYRGPDSEGVYCAPGIGLGFRRLAIVGLRNGEQPLFNEDRSIVVVCTGEIFNHRELRETLLASGHVIENDSDVAVLPHLYEEHGDDLVEHLNGQFAFALWDNGRRRLLLARDHFGIAPMHYATVGQVLVFGSEVKALLEHDAIVREVDPAGLDHVLTLPGLVSPTTMFRGVASLPPAHMLVAEDGRTTVRRYWDLEYPRQDAMADPADDGEHVERLRQALRRAVDLRMRADVDHGHYVSGGLDSALIAGLSADLAPDRPLRSFSVVVEDERLSERPWQQLVAARLGAEHTEVVVAPGDLVAGLPTVIRHCECPLKESYNVASYLLSRAVSEAGFKVVLTGEGSDELFAGYVGYRFDRMAARVRPGGTMSDEQRLRQCLFGNAQLAYQGDLLGSREARRRLYSDGHVARLSEFDATREPLVDVRMLVGRDVLHQRSYLDVKLRLADHLLGDHGDRMALANAVEARYPFLDPDVAACAIATPPDLKLRRFEEKHLVKRAADGLVPDAIIQREKFAFATDASPVLLRERADLVREFLDPVRLRREGYFDPAAVGRLVDHHRQRDDPLDLIVENDFLMVVLTFGMFLDAFDVR